MVDATRLPNGDVILEGSSTPSRSAGSRWSGRVSSPGAFRLPPAKSSGAFFVAVHGRHPKGGTFKLHAALRGAPVRYTGLRTVRLNPTP